MSWDPRTTEDLPDDGAWFPVEPDGPTGGVRRAAARLAEQIGLPEQRAADWAIVVAEAASNLMKHADEGALLLRAVRHAGDAGVELIAVDRGPGMADVRRSARDGHSTAGTLGIGLGAIARLATWYDTYSYPGQGTVLVAQVWPGEAPSAWAAGVARALPGEYSCGDAYAIRTLDRPGRPTGAPDEPAGRRQVLVSDGLGHGALAAAASQAAVNAFHTAPDAEPTAVVEHLHRELRGTRGAALAVAELDRAAGVVRYCGLGNIAAAVVTEDTVRRLVTLPGIAGHQRRQLRTYEYPLPPASVVVMHSDGVRDRWQPADHPGLFDRSPHLIAAVLLRDAGLRRDDACVLAARAEP
jgi:anti-sigma regulatory factor (Ser/Thr protein kinase)